jgi:hypothetical protein
MIKILFGPIASGKSTYARRSAEGGAFVVNDDAIVMACHGGVYAAYEELHKPLYKLLELQIIHYAVHDGADVIIDRPNLKRNTRERYIQIANALDVTCGIVTFRGGAFSGVSDGYRRWASDDRGHDLEYWHEVGCQHARQVEEPSDIEWQAYDFIEPIKWDESLFVDNQEVPDPDWERE